MSILARIVEETRDTRVKELGKRRLELRRAAEEAPAARPLAAALRRAGEVALLAELKRRSPSAGWLRRGAEAREIAGAYEAGGAAAMSVLTEPAHFGGSLEDLAAARTEVSLPILRKDFTVDALQVWEARAAEADGVLLIVRLVEDGVLRDLLGLSGELGMAALVEVHGGRELERALAAGARVVGINNRDLETFRTDLGVSLELAPEIPSECVVVAESGIEGARDVERLGEAGVDAVLVGESLMRAPDPRAAAAALVGRPRGARGGGVGGVG